MNTLLRRRFRARGPHTRIVFADGRRRLLLLGTGAGVSLAAAVLAAMKAAHSLRAQTATRFGYSATQPLDGDRQPDAWPA